MIIEVEKSAKGSLVPCDIKTSTEIMHFCVQGGCKRLSLIITMPTPRLEANES